MKKTVLFWLLSVAAPAAALGDPPPLTWFEALAQPPEPDGATDTDRLAFARDEYERMTVPVRLAGAGPFRFLVDTGSDRTAVSRELAGRLGLEPRPNARMHSATGQTEVAMAAIPELTLSRKAVRRINAPLLDRDDIGADGILGIDSLRSHRVMFDFASQTLTIESAEGFAARDEEGTIVISARRREGRLVITDAEAEGQPLSVVLDTGSQLSVANQALRRKLERRGALSLFGPIDLVSVTGHTLRGELAIIREIEIGKITVRDLVVVLADAHTFRQLQLDRTPALLFGMNALKSFDKVSIDFASRKLRFVLPKGENPKS